MGEVRFYHLTERPLEQVLPVMLARSLERGWRVLVRGTDPARIETLSARLWSHGDASFLPHGTQADGQPERQPVWLCCDTENPNDANTLFLIDNAEAELEELAAMAMVAVLFDGLDEAAVARAREQWRLVSEAGLKAVYWAQDEGGAWVKKHETG
ncbi:MAG: DNA polymerase III subunit chi [Proteobacteria bacterium]|nr:DNA polymerase III subunit chi [Pseudomonadota bacterium]